MSEGDGPQRTHRHTGTSRHTLLLTLKGSAASAIAGYAFNLFVLPFVIDRIGSDLYGAWATVASILTVGALADAGLRTEITRRVGAAKGAGDDEALVRAVHEGTTLVGLVAAAVLVLGLAVSPLIRTFAFPSGVPGYGPTEIDLLFRATFVVLAIGLLGSAYFGVLWGVQRGDVETVGRMVGLPFGAAVTVGGVAGGWGLWALFAGSATDLAVMLTWEWFGCRRLLPMLHPRVARITRPIARAYLGFSGLAVLAQISDVVDSQWDKLVVSHFVGSAAVTSLHIGTTMVLQGKVLALLPVNPLLAAVAELRSRDAVRLEEVYRMLAKAGAVVGGVILGGIFVFAPSFIGLWLGPGERDAGTVARLFVIAAALNLLVAPLAMRAFGEGWYSLAGWSAVVNMVVNGVTSLVLTIEVGLKGALYGSIVGTAVGAAVLLLLMWRRMGSAWRGPPLRAPAVAVAVTGATVLAGLDDVSSWLALAVGAGLYAALVGGAGVVVERLRWSSLLARA